LNREGGGMIEKILFKNKKFMRIRRVKIIDPDDIVLEEEPIIEEDRRKKIITDHDYFLCKCIADSGNYIFLDHDDVDIQDNHIYMNQEMITIKKDMYEKLSPDAKEIIKRIHFSPINFLRSLASISYGSFINSIKLKGRTIDQCMKNYKGMRNPKRIKIYLRNNFREKYSCSLDTANRKAKKIISEIKNFISI